MSAEDTVEKFRNLLQEVAQNPAVVQHLLQNTAGPSRSEPQQTQQPRFPLLPPVKPKKKQGPALTLTGNGTIDSNLLFTNLKNNSQTAKKTAPPKNNMFCRDLILLKSPKTDSPVPDSKLEELGENGFFFEGVKFERTMTSIEVRSKIYEKFVRKLIVVDFDILHVHNKKLRKFFASKQDLDGEFLHSRTDASQKVYIRPKSCIDYDESEVSTDTPQFSSDQPDDIQTTQTTKKRERNKDYDSDEDDDVFLPKQKGTKKEFTVRSIPSYCLNNLTDEYIYVTVARGQLILPILYKLLTTPGTSLTARLNVQFERERGAGHGTVKEMFHLALGEIKENVLLEGNIFSKTLKKCTPDLEAGIFNHMGEICAWSMIQGGPPPNFFSRTFATILLHSSEKAKQNLTLEDVLNPAVQREIKAVIDAESLMEINNAMANSTIFQCGETLSQVHGESYLSQRDNAVKGALQFYCVNRILGEAESFASGFNRDLQLLSKLKEVTGAEVFLTHSDQKLTTKTFLAQFQIADNVRKSLSFRLFRRYLEASENHETTHELSEVLQFITGFDKIPPFGFGLNTPKIVLGDTLSPVARDCFNVFELPENLDIDCADEFQLALEFAISDKIFTLM